MIDEIGDQRRQEMAAAIKTFMDENFLVVAGDDLGFVEWLVASGTIHLSLVYNTGSFQLNSFMNQSTTGVRLYVGNLPYSMRAEDLFKMFAEFGKVMDVVVMMEPGDAGRSKGFGFVTMENQAEADKAVKAINGKDLLGRALVCNVAKPREPRFRF